MPLHASDDSAHDTPSSPPPAARGPSRIVVPAPAPLEMPPAPRLTLRELTLVSWFAAAPSHELVCAVHTISEEPGVMKVVHWSPPATLIGPRPEGGVQASFVTCSISGNTATYVSCRCCPILSMTPMDNR